MAFGQRSSGEAKYQQVADRIRAAIQSGELRPGQALPTEKQLAAQYGVSRPTVRSALATLRAEGLIDAQQGRGAFVRLRPVTRRLPAPQLSDAVTQGNDRPEAQKHIIEAGPAPARGAVADLLGVEDGHQAFVRRRLITTPEGEPLELSAHYFPIIQKPAGRDTHRTASLLSARMPSPTEAATLRIPDGVPLLEVLVASYDADGTPIQVIEALLPADRYAIYDEQPSGLAVNRDQEDARREEK
ncbi:MAG TPA: GntR family transcriptional regulator [Actinomycetes bacterium]|nr:GntR family transcriptional regulator [Actinomycetes bacterium]